MVVNLVFLTIFVLINRVTILDTLHITPKDVNVESLPSNYVRDVAYQFRTDLGQIITVLNDYSLDAEYGTPTTTVDTQCKRVPIQIIRDGFIIEIGFAAPEFQQTANVNVYKNLFSTAMDRMLTSSTGSNIGQGVRDKLAVYEDVYPISILDTTVNFEGKDINDSATTWSASPVNYSVVNPNFPKFKLPVVTATVPLNTGEVLICHCLASVDSGYWTINNLPTLADLLKDDYVLSNVDIYKDNIAKMEEGYNRALRMLIDIVPDILIGDYSNEYVILSLDSSTIQYNNFGINTDVFDKYAYLRLRDNSIYLLYENSGVKSVLCVAGNQKHELSTDWSDNNLSTVDSSDGNTYTFTWVVNVNNTE